MGKLAEVEGNGEHQVEKRFDTKITTTLKHIANPVVYKLVRVEGDGSLVPATDDEVMEVENLFEDEKVEASLIADTGQVEACVLNEESSSLEDRSECSEGKVKDENTKVDTEKLNARLEYIGVMLQKVKQEEKLRLSSSSPNYSSGQCSDQPDKLSAVEKKLKVNHSLHEQPHLSSPRLNNGCTTRRGTGETFLKPTGNLEVGGSSASASSSSSMPDFSRIKGEICLDNLTVRELQETFRATFGRETTVKDKSWLKRRIAMGLINSCNVPTTNFIIKDNVLIETKAREVDSVVEISNNANQSAEMVSNSCKDSPTSPISEVGGSHVVSCKRLRNPQAEYECKTEDVCFEQSAAKRVRKPTRRYIEELSEAEPTESGGRPVSTVQSSGHGQSSPKSRVRSICDGSCDETILVTRQDSFGGSGVQVPYVSRVRRGRPRENFMSIMQYHPNGNGIEARLVRETLDVGISQQDSESGDRNWKDEVSPKQIQQQVVAKTDQEKENVIKYVDEQEQKGTGEMETLGSFENDSDSNVTFQTLKDGVRRKHHRPWTLSEVIKLVEGVSKYGIGRWSEIKKVSFASYAYRTSVDLKDKWRNLLRASFAHGSNDQMSNSRKHGSIPIPAPVLLRVRQLAEKHSQPVPAVSLGKFRSSSGRSVLETRSGYL